MATDSLPNFPADSRLFFLYGTDQVKMGNARRDLVARFVPLEERDQHVTEIEPAASRPNTLDSVLGQVVDELLTPAFFPDQRRLVLLSGVKDFFEEGGRGGAGGARPAKKKPSAKSSKSKKSAAASEAAPRATAAERFVEFLRGDFATATRNVLIILAEENDDKARRIAEKSPLVDWLLNHAVRLAFREPPVRFDFEQAIYDRDAARAIGLLRDWLNADTRANVFSAIVSAVRMMLQVKVRDSSAPARAAVEEYFPPGRASLGSAKDFVARKAAGGARHYSVGELVRAHSALLDLNDAFYPPKGATFVPDLHTAVEAWLLRLCMQ